jgi:sugar lactone lactonase YvrE
MTVDSAGTLWVGHWDGGRVSRWSPDGRLQGEVALPARNVTSLAFGGEGLAEVVVTTAALFPGHEEAGPGFHGDLLGWRGERGGLPEPVLRADWLG